MCGLTGAHQSPQNSMTSKTLIATALVATLSLGTGIGIAIADQPFMHSALTNLRQAKHDLERADSDKGGHRLKAIGDVDAAIAETEEGIRFDRHH